MEFFSTNLVDEYVSKVTIEIFSFSVRILKFTACGLANDKKHSR
jgi:hypothetical protein